MIKYLLALTWLLLCFSNVFGQNLLTNSSFELGTLGSNTAPTGWTTTRVDYNDPASATNDPRVQSPTITNEWIQFDDVATNNNSQDGGRAVGGEHADWFAYDLSSTASYTAEANYTIYFEHSNPGLDDGTGGTLNDDPGFWRFRLGDGAWVNGPVISMTSTIGSTQWSTVKIQITAGTSATPEFRIQARRATSSDVVYLEIDNVILVPECTDDLGILAANTIYADLIVCHPETTIAAQNKPGVLNINPASCDISSGDPTAVITIPTFDCGSVTAVSFDTPVLPSNPRVLYHYWGNCAPLSPPMPEVIDPPSNGYIQQMFCETDAFGLPAFKGGLSGENGIIDFLPQVSEDVGCNGFVEVGTTCTCGASPTVEKTSELIQIDFWMAVPTVQSEVGFRFSQDNRQDAGAFFVGASLTEMCEVNFYTDGPDHDSQLDQSTGTYKISNGQLSETCGLRWMRVRLYINDVADQFSVEPQINAGNGWVDIDQLLIEPALTADDNVVPTVTTTTVTGYLSGTDYIYDDGGTWDPYGCNPTALSGLDPGTCMFLDVELSEFNVKAKKESAVLNWTTTSEINSDKFIIERSHDGKSFNSIGVVQSNGNSTHDIDYEFIDNRPLAGISYYRLQEVSLDGISDYSKVVSVDFTANSDIEIYPNPASDQLYWNNATENLSYKMMNVHGQEVSSGLIDKSNGVLDLSTFNRGLYFMKIYNQNNELAQTIKVLISNN